MRILQKKVTAAFVIVVLGLGSLTACQGNAPQAKETPKPTQTTPSPTRTTEKPTPSPTPTAVGSFDFTDEQGYTYEYTVEQLPEFYATIDTTQGPPGYTMVQISYAQPARVSIKNTTAGGKVAPEPQMTSLLPLWTPAYTYPDRCSGYVSAEQEKPPPYYHTDYRAVNQAWDWGESTAVFDPWHSGVRWNTDTTSSTNNCPATGNDNRRYHNNVVITEFSYEGSRYKQSFWTDDGNYLHGYDYTLSNDYQIPGVYVVKAELAEDFARKMINPAGYVLTGPGGDENDTARYPFIEYHAPDGDGSSRINEGTIPWPQA